MTTVNGALRKMRSDLGSPVRYRLPIGDTEIALNDLIGVRLRLEFGGAIHCLHCDRKTKKSFNQGYCYPCFQTLAQCDSCIVSPEKCHFDAGTCREPEWAKQHCLQPHVIYLANSSGLKVGITRGTQIPTRWIDQGAVQALPILSVQTRQQSGLVETMLKQYVADKTNWRAMLKGGIDAIDLPGERDRLLNACAQPLTDLQQRFGVQAIQVLSSAEAIAIEYPVREYPTKIVSLDLEKTPHIEARLFGIKGQYLLFDTGVINIRKFGAYHVSLSVIGD